MSSEEFSSKSLLVQSFKVKIENFSKDKNYEFLSCVYFRFQSCLFSCSVYFIPYPSRKKSLITLRIFRRNFTNFKIFGTLSIKNHRQFIHFKPNEITKSFDFLSCNEILKKSNELMSGKVLILNFDIKILDVEKMYLEMMTMNEFSNLTFMSFDGEKFLVHRGVVEGKSEKLKAMINANGEVFFNTSAVVLKEFIRFLYAGKVENLQDVSFDLLKLTYELEIKEFWKKYKDDIIYSMSNNNVVDFLFFADDNKDKVLRRMCLKFIKRNFSTVRRHIDIQSTSRAFSLLMNYYEVKYFNKRIFIGSLFD
ncbi:hypothetical protein PVAND_012663 [Polypedilum vanderplanki]|uniref:BTB domain-containing protein n=1 Tax=Polypedilum vanderplanki TaxID=319348 RepID=A0A9J6CM68_POLVA|nr:hypothetical protein PVAND_012663 [Polypedilum vanderplanki]